MAYNGNEELSFASGYYHIGFAGFGVVTFEPDTPKEIEEQFWRVWPDFHKKVVERQREGLFGSEYPILPFDDPDENKRHYEGGQNHA